LQKTKIVGTLIIIFIVKNQPKERIMSELIQMRNRIKAIETIKKITHAMRLISMSSHSHLKKQQETLAEYTTMINTLFLKIQKHESQWTHPIIYPNQNGSTKKLIILIGSQKGLCGSFNNLLFQSFAKQTNASEPVSIIAVGKKAVDYVNEKAPNTLIATYPEFNTGRLSTIAQSLSSTIMQQEIAYTSVTIWSNVFKSFFAQKPEQKKLIPFDTTDTQSIPIEITPEGYLWEHTPQEVLNNLAAQYIEASIYHTLFESLLAEQAARFISMDSSTRSAQNLLDETRLQYNKIRQAKITNELTELIGSF
jgi:F-type H+-transporting ATPase subunit gamma